MPITARLTIKSKRDEKCRSKKPKGPKYSNMNLEELDAFTDDFLMKSAAEVPLVK